MTTTPYIQFASQEAATDNKQTTTPWSPAKTASTYEDMVLKPEYAARRLRFENGMNWFRIVPAFKSSAFGWMLGVHALGFEGGRFAHPKTLERGAKSVFDHAYAWIKERRPELLFSKTNKRGARLLSDPLCAFWAVIEEEGQTVARIFLGSGYDGSRGGPQGLGYQIWQASKERDERGEPVADIVGPERGVLVCVERTKSKDAKYPRYTLRLGRQPAPVDAAIAKMDSAEMRALCPLEQTVRQLTEEEQWKCLERVIDPATAALIRSDVEGGAL